MKTAETEDVFGGFRFNARLVCDYAKSFLGSGPVNSLKKL